LLLLEGSVLMYYRIWF